ncbi:protein NRDE2 homolog isoform X1 [Arapaima gigas]
MQPGKDPNVLYCAALGVYTVKVLDKVATGSHSCLRGTALESSVIPPPREQWVGVSVGVGPFLHGGEINCNSPGLAIPKSRHRTIGVRVLSVVKTSAPRQMRCNIVQSVSIWSITAGRRTAATGPKCPRWRTGLMMALFPAFAGASTTSSANEKAKELDWLSNSSFRSDAALTIHQRVLHKTAPEGQEDSDTGYKKRKKKDKKKKRKKHKTRHGDREESSGSESDTVYPSDLLKEDKATASLEEQVPAQSSFIWLDDLTAPTDRPFCIDKKSDAANWEYKSLYRGDIPRYKRKGNSSLGLDPKTQAVSWTDAKTSGKKRGDRTLERYFSRGGRQLLSATGHLVVPGSRGLGPNPKAVRFIPVPQCLEEEGSTDTPQAPSVVDPLGVYDSSTSLWLQGKGQQETDLQKQGGSAVTPGTGGSSTALLAPRVEDFNRRLRENPSDIPTWLNFVHFQDELAAGPSPFSSFEGDADRHKKSLKNTLEKKLSILERALESNPGSVELKLARLHLGRELWDPAVLLREWKQLVFLHPNNAELWRAYLLFIQGQFSTLTVSKVNAVYGKCLTTLASVQDGGLVSHPPLPGTEEAMLTIFLQQCHFLRQAGHSEKAVALFQAMLDFTFFKPDSVKEMPTRQQVEFFEPFWDSGEPRVGEKGARGWKAWMHQQERGGWLIPNELDDDDDDDQDDGSEVKDKTWPKWRIWLDVEASREANHWLPWRPDKTKGQSEEDCEDPDRQVLFDDVGPSMIFLSKPELRFELLCSLLRFLGLPSDTDYPPGPSWSVLLDNLALLVEQPDADRSLSCADPLQAGVCPVGHMTTLGAPQRWVGLCKQGEEFMQNVLHQIWPLLSAPERSKLSLYWIQYEKLKVVRCVRSRNKRHVRSQGKRSKKVAKRLLKEAGNRNDLALWREYGHIEWLLGNLEEARKVLDTALSLGLSRGLRDAALCDLCLLYAQLEVEQGAGSAAGTASPALHILTCLAEGGTYSPLSGQVSPVSILKARRTYEQVQETNLKPGFVSCFALFQYLTIGVEAADKVYQQATERLRASHTAPQEEALDEVDPDLEALCLARASLLRHVTSVCPLARLRDTLTSALSHFPSSSRLWKLYLLAESRYHNAGRARRFLHTVTCRTTSVTPRLFAIRAEQKRKELVDTVQRSDHYGDIRVTLPETGLSHRIRGLFESAVATENGSRCPLLWRMYIHFLVSEGNVDRGRGMFYRALQNIPWVKGLYMDAMLLFPDHMQEFLDLMQEKELRLRLPMEEVDILLED